MQNASAKGLTGPRSCNVSVCRSSVLLREPQASSMRRAPRATCACTHICCEQQVLSFMLAAISTS